MKILLALFVALVLILGSFPANAKRVLLEERQLLSDAHLGQKVTAGPNDKVATENPQTKTKNGADTEVNKNSNNYGDDSDTESHRYFPDDQHKSTPTTSNNKPRSTP